MDDDTLMQRTAAGDLRAFASLVRAHQPCLLRVATRLLGDAEAGQDVTVEAFVRLWRVRDRWRACGALEAFLLRTVRNLCRDHVRQAIPSPALLSDDAPSEQDVAGECQSHALAEAVRDAVLMLPEPQRIVFILSQYEGRSYAEIATILQCPLGTVASRKRLALETLRRNLRMWQSEEERNPDED